MLAVATGAAAQNAADPNTPASGSASVLKLPDNPQIFGQAMPSVVKATAIVNGQLFDWGKNSRALDQLFSDLWRTVLE